MTKGQICNGNAKAYKKKKKKRNDKLTSQETRNGKNNNTITGNKQFLYLIKTASFHSWSAFPPGLDVSSILLRECD